MRTIKFRTYSETAKDFAYQGTSDLETIQSFFFHYGDCEIQQFTGLIDKNGKEIYEGDFLYDPETGDEGNDISASYVVEFKEDWGCWVIDNSFKRDGSHYAGIVGYFGYENLEVIGNIHENPELLSTPTAVL